MFGPTIFPCGRQLFISSSALDAAFPVSLSPDSLVDPQRRRRLKAFPEKYPPSDATSNTTDSRQNKSFCHDHSPPTNTKLQYFVNLHLLMLVYRRVVSFAQLVVSTSLLQASSPCTDDHHVDVMRLHCVRLENYYDGGGYVTTVVAKTELAPNLSTSHHTHVSPHRLQRFILINPQIVTTARRNPRVPGVEILDVKHETTFTIDFF